MLDCVPVNSVVHITYTNYVYGVSYTSYDSTNCVVYNGYDTVPGSGVVPGSGYYYNYYVNGGSTTIYSPNCCNLTAKNWEFALLCVVLPLVVLLAILVAIILKKKRNALQRQIDLQIAEKTVFLQNLSNQQIYAQQPML